MDINLYLSNNWKELLQICKNIAKDNKTDAEDVCQELVLELLEMPKDKQDKILSSGGIKYYFIMMAKYSIQSNSSRYQRKYNKIKISDNIDTIDLVDETQDFDIIDIIDIVDNIIKKELTWSEKKIFKMHVKEGKTFKQMESLTKVPATSIYNIYRSGKLKIQKKLSTMELFDRISNFMETLRGRNKMEHKEIVKLFELYNELHNTVEKDYHCSLCVIRIYNSLKKYITR